MSQTPSRTAPAPARPAASERLLCEAQPAEAVQDQRGEHLPGDEQPDGDECAETGKEQNACGDVERASQAADELPRLGVVDQLQSAEGARER